MLRLGIPVIGVTDIPRAVAFWTAALPLVATEEWRSETWRTLEYADGSGRALGLLRSDSPPEPRPRLTSTCSRTRPRSSRRRCGG
ncbi:hypothetical protein SUDANB9_00847 [Streptomyces sp. enrichment culture]